MTSTPILVDCLISIDPKKVLSLIADELPLLQKEQDDGFKADLQKVTDALNSGLPESMGIFWRRIVRRPLTTDEVQIFWYGGDLPFGYDWQITLSRHRRRIDELESLRHDADVAIRCHIETMWVRPGLLNITKKD